MYELIDITFGKGSCLKYTKYLAKNRAEITKLLEKMAKKKYGKRHQS